MSFTESLNACRLRVRGIRGTLHSSSIHLTAAETFTNADNAVRERLPPVLSLTQGISLLAFKRAENVWWTWCWASLLCHHESPDDDRDRIYPVVRRRHRCSARHGHSLWTSLRCIGALLLLSGQSINRKEHAARTGRSYLPVHQFAQADYGQEYSTYEASRPWSRNDSDLRPPDPPPNWYPGSKSSSGLHGAMGEGKVPGKHVGTNLTGSGRDGAVATRDNPTIGSNPRGDRTEAHHGVSIVGFSSRRRKQAGERENDATEPGSELPSDHSESIKCASEVSASGRVTFKLSAGADPTAVAGAGLVSGEKGQRQELASRSRPHDDTVQRGFKDGGPQRLSQHEKPVQEKQTRVKSDVQQQRRTNASPDTHDNMLQQDKIPNVPTNEKQVHAQGGKEQDEADGRPQGNMEGVTRPVSGSLSNPLQDSRDQHHAGNHQGQRTTKANGPKASHKQWSASDVSASRTSSPSPGNAGSESSMRYFDDERLSRGKLRAAQNALMADVTAHLSRLWRKHWLHAIEALQHHCYEARLEAFQVIVEQMEIAVNSVVMSRPRAVSLGLGRWLHKVREVFIFVFSTRLGLGVASANLRPVGPLAATAHDVPEESAEVVEVVTGASQRVLLLAPPSREENARCYIGGPRNAWQHIQASLFPAGMEAQLVETRASLAKLLDFLGENVVALAEDHHTPTSELEDALTRTADGMDTCIDGSCRHRLMATPRDGRGDTAHSIKHVNDEETPRSQHPVNAYMNNLYHRTGSDYKRSIPYSSRTISTLPLGKGESWRKHVESGVRLSNSPQAIVSENGDLAVRRRRASISRSENDLHKSEGVQLPVMSETMTTPVEERTKPLFSPAGAYRTSATSEVTEGHSAGNDMLSLKRENPAAQKSTRGIEEVYDHEEVSSSTSSETRAPTEFERGDLLAHLAKVGSRSRDTRDSVLEVEVNELPLEEGSGSSSKEVESKNITSSSKESSFSGLYQKLLEAEERAPPFARVRLDSSSAAGGPLKANETFACSAATSLGKALDGDLHVPVGAPSAVSRGVPTNTLVDFGQSDRPDPTSAEKVEGAGDAAACKPEVENGVERGKSNSGDAFVNMAQNSDAPMRRGPLLDSGNAALRLASKSVSNLDSHFKGHRQNHAGGERADATATDKAGRGSVGNRDTDTRTDVVLSKDLLGSDDGSTDGSTSAAQLQSDRLPLPALCTSRTMQSYPGRAGPYSESCTREEETNASSGRGSRERPSSTIGCDAPVDAADTTLNSSIDTPESSSKRGGDGGLPAKMDSAANSKVTDSDATDVRSYSKNPATAKRERGGSNFSNNGKHRRESRSAGSGHGTPDNRNDNSANQSRVAQSTRSISSGGHSGVETASSDVSAKRVTKGADQSSKASGVGGGTAQETIGSAGRTSRADNMTAHGGQHLTEGPADGLSHEGNCWDSTGRDANTTRTRESAGISEGRRHFTHDSEGSAATHLRTTGSYVIGDGSPSGKQTSEVVGSNADGTELDDSRRLRSGAKTTKCNSIKTDRGVDVVYCINEESDEDANYEKGIDNGIASLGKSVFLDSLSSNVPVDTHWGRILTRQTPRNDKAVGEVQLYPQREAQHRSLPLQMSTPEHADPAQVREPLIADQEGGDSLPPGKGAPGHTSHGTAAAEKASQSPWPERKKVDTVSSEAPQPQKIEPPKDLMTERKELQQKVPPGTALQPVQFDEPQEKQASERSIHQISPQDGKMPERNGVQPPQTQLGVGGVDKETFFDQQEDKRKHTQVALLKTAEQIPESAHGDEVLVKQQRSLAQNQLRVTKRQPSAAFSGDVEAQPAKHLPGEGRPHQQQEQSSGHTGQDASFEGSVDLSLSIQQGMTSLLRPQQTSSEQQHQIDEKQDIHKQPKAQFPKARAQGKRHSPSPSPLFQKKTSSEEQEVGLDKFILQRNSMQHHSPDSPRRARRGPQAAVRQAQKTLESAAGVETSKQDITKSLKPESLPGPDNVSTKTTESANADALPKQAVPEETDRERKEDGGQSVTSGDLGSVPLPAAGGPPELNTLDSRRPALHPTDTAETFGGTVIRDALGIEPTYRTTAAALSERTGGEKSPVGSRAGVKGNVEQLERGQERAVHSVQPKADVQHSAPLLKQGKKEQAAQPRQELLKRRKHLEQEQPRFSKMELPPGWLQAVRHREVQHHPKPRERMEHLHSPQKEALRRPAGQQVVAPQHVRELHEAKQEVSTSLQASAAPRRQGREQADDRVRRGRRWARLPWQQQQLKGVV